MLNLLQSRAVLMLWAGAIATLGAGCNLLPTPSPNSQSNPANTTSLPTDTAQAQPANPVPTPATPDTPPPAQNSSAETSPAATSTPETAETTPQAAPEQAAPEYDPYPDAVNRASAAFTLSQSAQSQDDWRLVSNRWQQAIELMTAVPASSPNHATAQEKLTEYRRNLSYAREQAATPIPEIASGDNVITIPITSAEVSSGTNREPRRTASPSTPIAGLPQGNGVFTAPIVRRSGGTPVVLVTFNGNQTFEMIVDTGASGTVITQPMARALNVTPVGSTNVATASARSATFLLGYVNSMEVAGARTENTLVAIAGPELGTGLLGHDFFGNYDVTVRENVVEFRER